MCRPGGRRCPSSLSKSHNGHRPSRSAKAVAVRALAPVVAEELHEAWRAGYDRRTYGDRVETTTDAAYIREHGSDKVILNKTALSELPPDVAARCSLGDAKSALGYVSNNLAEEDKLRTGKRARAQAGEKLHEEWLQRNKWATNHEEFSHGFKKAPEDHQAALMSPLDAGLAQLEPVTNKTMDVYMSTDDPIGAAGLFTASAAADLGLNPGEKVIGVENLKRRRNGTFEDGTPRWKWSGNAIVKRPPLVEKKPRKPRQTVAEKGSTAPAAKASVTTESPVDYTSRDVAIKSIRSALKERSGKAWSVRGGVGTAWGWITISSPPKRHVNHRMTEEDTADLHKLLGLPWNPNHGVTAQSITVADTGEHRREFVARAQGRTPDVVGKQYWD